MNMTNVKARYENNVLRPLEKLDLGEGEEVEGEREKEEGERKNKMTDCKCNCGYSRNLCEYFTFKTKKCLVLIKYIDYFFSY